MGLLKSMCVFQRNESAQKRCCSKGARSTAQKTSTILTPPSKRWLTAAVTQKTKSCIMLFEIHSYVEGGSEMAKTTSFLFSVYFQNHSFRMQSKCPLSTYYMQSPVQPRRMKRESKNMAKSGSKPTKAPSGLLLVTYQNLFFQITYSSPHLSPVSLQQKASHCENV